VECRATTTVLRVGDIRRQRIFRVMTLQTQHEAIGRVPWVNSTICVKYFTFHSGAQTLESYEIILTSYRDLLSSEIHYKVDRNPIFGSSTNGSKEPNNILSEHLRTTIRSHGLLINYGQYIIQIRLLITDSTRKNN
jgi:hypothetical protein